MSGCGLSDRPAKLVVMPAKKAASLLGIVAGQADTYDTLEAALRRHLIGSLGGDPYRDIDSLDVVVYPDGRAFCGRWRGHLRLTAAVVIENATTAKVLLIGSKGTVAADDSLFGKSGPDVGNSALIARLYHVALFAFRATGIMCVENDPYDLRVRRRYEDMGFQNGERLRLDDAAALTKAFDFVEQQYQHPSLGGGLSLASPPLPF